MDKPSAANAPTYLIELFLPLQDNEGNAFARAQVEAVRETLTRRFGGVTAFMRAPATGAWKDHAGRVNRDQVVRLEVMTDDMDRDWWGEFRMHLEAEFKQEEILVRATRIERL